MLHDTMSSCCRFAPIGICFLLAERIVNMWNLAWELEALALFIGTVAAGLSIHAFIILPGIYAIFVRRNPFQFGMHMLPAILTALGTSSR